LRPGSNGALWAMALIMIMVVAGGFEPPTKGL
jgi:hypothetical protein